MDEKDLEPQTSELPQTPEAPTPSYTPATPTAQILAWIGVVVMVLLTLAFAYSTATGCIFWA